MGLYEGELKMTTEFKTKDLNKLLFRKPVEVLIILYNNNNCSLSQLLRKCECSYPYIPAVIRLFEYNKIVTKTKKGRACEVKLTAKGERICEILSMLRSEIKD